MSERLDFLQNSLTQVEMVASYNVYTDGVFTATKFEGETTTLPIYISNTGNLCTNMYSETGQ